jgi:hypothetical protein
MQSIFDEPFSVQRAGELRPVYRDHACVRCGYNRKGLAADAVCPECGQRPTDGYGAWLEQQLVEAQGRTYWPGLALMAALGGLFAVVGALVSELGGLWGLVVFGPAIEEVLKVGLVVMALETRPQWLTRRWEIWLVTVSSALAFAAIENVIYLNVYLPDPSQAVVLWRWMVCTALHVGCTMVATLGVLRMWRSVWVERKPAQPAAALPWLVVAVVIHGSYNAVAMAMAVGGLGP